MRKLIALAALAGLPFAAAQADGDIGCGLGTQIMAGQSGVIFKVLGVTTNGTFGNQTFGITSGTLGCSSDGVITAQARRSMFAAANVDQLAADMAAGSGEALETLAALYKVEAADIQAFYSLAQAQHATLFPTADVSTGDVLVALETAMAKDVRLARYAG